MRLTAPTPFDQNRLALALKPNPAWIEKGIARAERNAIKARLPIQLLKAALTKAIAAGEAKQSGIIEAQRRLSEAWEKRDSTLASIDKRIFFSAAQAEYGDSASWDADTWQQVIDDLKGRADWIVRIKPTDF